MPDDARASDEEQSTEPDTADQTVHDVSSRPAPPAPQYAPSAPGYPPSAQSDWGYPPPAPPGYPQGEPSQQAPSDYPATAPPGYPPQGYPPQGYPPQGYPPPGYPPPGYPPPGYPPQGYQPPGYPPQGYPPQGYPQPPPRPGPVDALGRPMADWWRRLLAYLIDALVLGVPWSIILSVTESSLTTRNTSFTTGNFTSSTWVGLGIGFIVVLGYFAFLDGSPRGQTLGKLVLGISVRDIRTGGPIGAGRAARKAGVLLRHLLRVHRPVLLERPLAPMGCTTPGLARQGRRIVRGEGPLSDRRDTRRGECGEAALGGRRRGPT